MKTGLIRLGPAYDSLLVMRDDVTRRTVYDEMKILTCGAPVVVDHDPNHVVGLVLDLHRLEFSELGGTRWLTARVHIDDDAPSWLRTGTPASISYKSLWRRDDAPNSGKLSRRGQGAPPPTRSRSGSGSQFPASLLASRNR